MHAALEYSIWILLGASELLGSGCVKVNSAHKQVLREHRHLGTASLEFSDTNNK